MPYEMFRLRRSSRCRLLCRQQHATYLLCVPSHSGARARTWEAPTGHRRRFLLHTSRRGSLFVQSDECALRRGRTYHVRLAPDPSVLTASTTMGESETSPLRIVCNSSRSQTPPVNLSSVSPSNCRSFRPGPADRPRFRASKSRVRITLTPKQASKARQSVDLPDATGPDRSTICVTTEFIRLPSCRFANGLHLGVEPKAAADRNVQLTISKCARQPLSNKR